MGGEEGCHVGSIAQGRQGAEAARGGKGGLHGGGGQAEGTHHRGQAHLVGQEVAHVGQAGRGKPQVQGEGALFADEFAFLCRGQGGVIDLKLVIFLGRQAGLATLEAEDVGELAEGRDAGFAGDLFDHRGAAGGAGFGGMGEGGGLIGHGPSLCWHCFGNGNWQGIVGELWQRARGMRGIFRQSAPIRPRAISKGYFPFASTVM